jgi:polyhydroxyalkanoate synthesis regulator phasin
MSDEKRHEDRKRMGIGEGIKSGIGILAALKQAVEESIQEAVDRGDLSPDRAKDAVQGAMRRAQDALQDTFGDVRERLDVIPRREFDELRAAVAELSRRVDEMEGRGPVPSDHLLPPS